MKLRFTYQIGHCGLCGSQLSKEEIVDTKDAV